MKSIKIIKRIMNSYSIAIASLITAIIVATCDSSSSSNNSGGNVQAVAAGNNFTLVIKKDGTVWSFGKNYFGQLGLGTTADTSTAKQVINIIDASAVSAGSAYTLVLKKDGTLWSFGNNQYGQLGLGNNINSNIPMQVTNNVSNDVQAISAGAVHTLILKKDSTLWAFGNNLYGQLGFANNDNTSTAKQVIALGNDVQAIAAGGNYSLVLKKDGTLWSFGNNEFGQLGLGNNINSNFPNQVNLNVSNDVQAIAAGLFHSLLLKKDGTVWAFGRNDLGQLGIANISDQNLPNIVTTLSNDNKDIFAGNSYSLVLKNDGTVIAFGSNNSGQLGLGNINPSIAPTKVTTLSNDVSEIATSLDDSRYSIGSSLALKKDGTLWSFGANENAQLGLGYDSTSVSTPTKVNLP